MAAKTKNFEGAVGSIEEKVSWLQKITFSVMIALAAGFVALFISAVSIFHGAYTNKAATYLELVREVQKINQKLDDLTLKWELQNTPEKIQ